MAAKAARLVRLSRLFGSREGPAKLNTPGKAELGPAGNAVFFPIRDKVLGEDAEKGSGCPRGVPRAGVGVEDGAGTIPWGLRSGCGRPPVSLTPNHTEPGAAATHAPITLHLPPRQLEPREPNPGTQMGFQR